MVEQFSRAKHQCSIIATPNDRKHYQALEAEENWFVEYIWWRYPVSATLNENTVIKF